MRLLEKYSRRKAIPGKDGSALFFLIVINVILYIILSGLDVMYMLSNSTEDVFRAQVLSWFSVPAQPPVFATRPWTLLSFMFTHFGAWDLISNMLWLGGFGFIMKELTGNRMLAPLYLYGGFTGAIVFLLTVNLIPSISDNVNSVYPLIGSGPATMAIAVAATTMFPRYRIFPMLKVPLWAVTALFVLIKVGTTGYANPGHLAALAAGGLMGYVFIWQLWKGNDMGLWMINLVHWTDNLFNPEKKNQRVPTRDRLFYKSTKAPFEKTPHITQQRVDDLLDKINVKGYDSLTQEEKDFLKKASRENL